jgi:DNA helicase HerA-like ATPase
VVDQDPSQLITGTIKNTSFRIVHRLPHQQDREALSASMLLRPDQRDFLSLLPTGQAIISTEQDDAPCWVKIKGEGAKS